VAQDHLPLVGMPRHLEGGPVAPGVGNIQAVRERTHGLSMYLYQSRCRSPLLLCHCRLTVRHALQSFGRLTRPSSCTLDPRLPGIAERLPAEQTGRLSNHSGNGGRHGRWPCRPIVADSPLVHIGTCESSNPPGMTIWTISSFVLQVVGTGVGGDDAIAMGVEKRHVR
jgi:hypothetical protein